MHRTGKFQAKKPVTHRGQPFNTCMREGNDKWRCSSILVFQVEAFVIGGYKKPDDGGASNIKYNDTNVDTFNGFR